MKSNAKLFMGILISGMLLFSGCATSTSKLSIDTSHLSTVNKSDAVDTVYVKTIVDERIFDPNTSDPSTPSIDGETQASKDLAIGRKRNSYGKAMGKIVLPEDQNIRILTKSAIESALIDNGWKVIQNDNEIDSNTKIIDIKIKKFWSWMNPGFWAITLSANIEANIPKSPNTNEEVTVEGFYKEYFQLGTESNYSKVLQEAYNAFIRDAKDKLKSPQK